MDEKNHATNSFVKMAVAIPRGDGIFDYSIPPEMIGNLRPGMMAAVPFKNYYYQSVVIETMAETSFEGEIKPVFRILDEKPVLTEAQLNLAKTLSDRCLTSLSECINILLTEKMRLVCKEVYFAEDFPSMETQPAQKSLFSQTSSFVNMDTRVFNAHDILSFIRDYQPISDRGLDDAFGKEGWRKIVSSLLGEKIVRKEYLFEPRAESPKMKEKVTFSHRDVEKDDSAPRFSRIKKVEQRRGLLLNEIRKFPNGVFLEELKETLPDLKREDINALKKTGFIELTMEEVFRNYENNRQSFSAEKTKFPLTDEQSDAVAIIRGELERSGRKTPILINGVTGSGKTEVFLQTAELALAQGKQVLALIPEISLAPMAFARFNARFPGQVGLYHSKLSAGEKFDVWRRGRDGGLKIIIGPRSALAVPLPDLGCIIVDECHDDSYYHTLTRPYFSAVQACLDYANFSNALLILGSATPTAAQTFKAIKTGWHIVKLTRRATGVSAPEIHIVDMRQELKAGNSSDFSIFLQSHMRDTLQQGMQTILLLNRRGAAAYSFCHACGHSFSCPNCEIPLTWHESSQDFHCHFCGYKIAKPQNCPDCGKSEIRQFGIGIEKIEKDLQTLFPEVAVLRMDAETTAKKGAQEEIFEKFASHKADILLGTQMVAKGLDFPDVRLVGVILADIGTNFHDYRVDEHTYQMLTQFAGRAGRSRTPGIAILQTFQPERYSIRSAKLNHYDLFYQQEIARRKQMGYPPFSRMLRIESRHENEKVAKARIFALSEEIRNEIARTRSNSIKMIGPAPCFFQKLGGFYRWHLILRGSSPVDIVRSMNLEKFRVESDPPSLL